MKGTKLDDMEKPEQKQMQILSEADHKRQRHEKKRATSSSADHFELTPKREKQDKDKKRQLRPEDSASKLTPSNVVSQQQVIEQMQALNMSHVSTKSGFAKQKPGRDRSPRPNPEDEQREPMHQRERNSIRE